jgi:hypothetical protein
VEKNEDGEDSITQLSWSSDAENKNFRPQMVTKLLEQVPVIENHYDPRMGNYHVIAKFNDSAPETGRRRSRTDAGLCMYVSGYCGQKAYGCTSHFLTGFAEEDITHLCLKNAATITLRLIITGDCCHDKDVTKRLWIGKDVVPKDHVPKRRQRQCPDRVFWQQISSSPWQPTTFPSGANDINELMVGEGDRDDGKVMVNYRSEGLYEATMNKETFLNLVNFVVEKNTDGLIQSHKYPGEVTQKTSLQTHDHHQCFEFNSNLCQSP